MPIPPLEFGPLMENLDFRLSYLKITISKLGLLKENLDFGLGYWNQPSPSEWNLFIRNLGLRFGYFKTPTPNGTLTLQRLALFDMLTPCKESLIHMVKTLWHSNRTNLLLLKLTNIKGRHMPSLYFLNLNLISPPSWRDFDLLVRKWGSNIASVNLAVSLNGSRVTHRCAQK